MSELEAPEAPMTTASELLSAARTKMGLSQKEVADQLFLTTTFIRYIDDGEFEKIPKAAFIKGYIRSYARVVGLDGNEVIAIYERDEQLPPPSPAVGNVTEGPLEPTGLQGPIVQTGIVGLVALVLVVLLVWWLASGDEDPADTEPLASLTVAPAVATETSVDTPVPDLVEGEPASPALATGTSTVATPMASAQLAPAAADTVQPGPQESRSGVMATRAAEVTTGAATTASSTPPAANRTSADPAIENISPPAGDLAEVAPAETVDPAEKEIQVERVVDGETTYVTVYAAGDDEMQFTFTDECWVEIQDGEGDKIYGDLNRAGDIMTIYGRAPFDVLLGRAPATSMTYQGEPVDLARFTTRDQTARIRTARL